MNNLKKYCMFAVSNAKRQNKYIVVGAFFYAYYSAFAVNIQGYQTPLTDCFTTLYRDCLLAKTEGDSLFLFNKFNFIRKMPKDNEVTNSTKYSNAVSTPHSATTVNYTEIVKQELLVYDYPINIKKSLDEMFNAFIVSEFADDTRFRSETTNHYNVLKDFLTELHNLTNPLKS